ncbi:hypothetical protein TA3x_002225 [Tundrisphaera sp. TA3]|uniref:hypothetical protein n=1 Tax=Tundrisphaera sp. TA3 TaxID=3435775 RepID=UPI003EBAF118
MDWPRGILGTILCATAGAIGTMAMMLVARRFNGEWSDLAFRTWMRNYASMPLIGCTTVCACVGWATFAPAGPFRFAPTLAILFAACVPAWWLGTLTRDALFPHHKGDDPFAYEWPVVLVVVAPPIAVAFLIGRARGRSAKPTKPAEAFALE